MAQKNLYLGFSSFNFEQTKSFKHRDLELVKTDLLNHIFTRRGERVMMPAFGTIIPTLLFEPMTVDTIEAVRSEVLRVINYDPRVELLNLQVVPDYDLSTLLVAAQTLYIELNMTDTITLNLEFES